MTLNWMCPESAMTLNWMESETGLESSMTLNWMESSTGLESTMTLNWIGVHYDFKLNSNGPNTWNDNRTERLWLYDDKLRVCHDLNWAWLPWTSTRALHWISLNDTCQFELRGSVKNSDSPVQTDSLLLIYFDSTWLFGSIKHNQFDKLLGME